jgi:hypothetical protein
MQRRTSGQSRQQPSKRPMLPPKRVPRPALKPQPRVMNKQHRGGR